MINHSFAAEVTFNGETSSFYLDFHSTHKKNVLLREICEIINYFETNDNSSEEQLR